MGQTDAGAMKRRTLLNRTNRFDSIRFDCTDVVAGATHHGLIPKSQREELT
jgi:hypothetical protein